MADRKRIVQIDPLTGDVTSLIDLDDGITYAAVANTFQIQQGGRGQALAQRSGRYGGADVASEQHENDKLTWQALVRGNTTDEVLENCEAMLIATERAYYDTFIEWRASAATRSTYYAIRGPAEFELTHESIRLESAKAEYVNVTFPIEPLARGAMYTQAIPTTNLPATWQIGLENLVTNPAFEGNATTGYTAQDFGTGTVTLTSSTSAPHAGTYGCRVQRTAGSAVNAGFLCPVTVVAGATYTFGAWVRPSAATMGADTLTIGAVCLDGSSAAAGPSTAVDVPWTATNTWQRVSITFTAPATSRTASLYIYANGVSSGDYFDVDQVSCVLGQDDTYFDGASSGCSWRGTANASVSVNPTLGKGVDGTAPALMDVAFRHVTTTPPRWALFAWAKKPTAPLSGSVAPFGLIEAETASDSYTFSAVTSDATWHNSAGLSATVTTAGGAAAMFAVDPSTMTPDDFTRNTIDIEIWARIKVSSSLVSPRIVTSFYPDPGTGYVNNPTFGLVQYTPEFGAFGKLIQNAPIATNTKFRPVRLGTITMPVDKANPLKWLVNVTFYWANSSSSTIGLDYLVMVPVRRRACSRSGVAAANADLYPNYVYSTADVNKLIRSDLSGLAAAGTGAFVPDSGMGGSTIEPQAGDNSLFVWPSNLIPDDPQQVTTEHQVSYPNPTGKLYITPRYYLVR